MSIKHQNLKCLLLNANYYPLRIISWKKAMILSIKYDSNHNYGINTLDYFDNEYIQGVGDKIYKIPAVLKTKLYFDHYDRTINFSRKNLFIRDNYTCQYCGTSLPHNQLTYDHIIPKCRFSGTNKSLATNWKNVTTACRPCNHKKGNRTPKEANMTLVSMPYVPKYSYRYLPWYTDLITIAQDETYSKWMPYIQHLEKNYASRHI